MSDAGLEKFGKFIERYRRQNHWAQGQLGKLLDVRSSYITSLENGEIWPEPDIVDRIALLFGVPHKYLHAMLGDRPTSGAPRPLLI